MSVLVIAEHDNQRLKSATLNTITAASQLDKTVVVLVAGRNCRSAADSAAGIAGVSKVLLADAAHYEHPLAEELAPLVVAAAKDASHILAPASTFGKNLLPRVAALLDVAAISDITRIISPDTFVRPIYAGNGLLTIQSPDPVKVITVRATAFDAAPAMGGSATVETAACPAPVGISEFVSHALSKSERPELTTARIVISGGRGLGSAENFKLL